jgi:hypothetical protein
VSRKRAVIPPATGLELREAGGGVLLSGTPIACDAPRAADVAFLSHALAPASPRSRQLVTTHESLALRPDLAARATHALTPRTGRPFSLGELRLELVPTAFMTGAAGLLVEAAGQRVLYAGPLPPGGAQVAEARPADLLIVNAQGAEAERARPIAERLAELTAAVGKLREGGASPMVWLPVGPLVVDVARALSPIAGKGKVVASAAHASLLARARVVDASVPEVRRQVAGRVPEDGLVLAVPGKRPPEGPGLWLDPVVPAPRGLTWLPIASHADARALVAYARSTGASQVYVMHASDAGLLALAAAGMPGLHRLGPARQLALF